MEESRVPIPYKNQECKTLLRYLRGMEYGQSFCDLLDRCLSEFKMLAPEESRRGACEQIENFVGQFDKYKDDETLLRFLTVLGNVLSPSLITACSLATSKPARKRGRPRSMYKTKINPPALVFAREFPCTSEVQIRAKNASKVLSELDHFLRNPKDYAESYVAQIIFEMHAYELESQLGVCRKEQLNEIINSCALISKASLEEQSTEEQFEVWERISSEYQKKVPAELEMLKRKSIANRVELFFERHCEDNDLCPYKSASSLRSAYYRAAGHFSAKEAKLRRRKSSNRKEMELQQE